MIQKVYIKGDSGVKEIRLVSDDSVVKKFVSITKAASWIVKNSHLYQLIDKEKY